MLVSGGLDMGWGGGPAAAIGKAAYGSWGPQQMAVEGSRHFPLRKLGPSRWLQLMGVNWGKGTRSPQVVMGGSKPEPWRRGQDAGWSVAD